MGEDADTYLEHSSFIVKRFIDDTLHENAGGNTMKCREKNITLLYSQVREFLGGFFKILFIYF